MNMNITDYKDHRKSLKTRSGILTGMTSLLLLLLFSSCNNDTVKAPDVSEVKANVMIQRFDRDFYAIDTNDVKGGLRRLQSKYPDFLPVFMENVLELWPISDSSKTVFDETRRYLRISRKMYDTVQIVFKNTDQLEKEMKQAFRFVKYYFRDYKEPTLITMVGPLNALAQMSTQELTPNFQIPGYIAIGLQFYLGKDYSVYNDPGFINNVVPLYRSRRFSKEYITADVMKLIIDERYPDRSRGKALITQMIERGKRWWLLDKLMPNTPDSIKTGFTSFQLAGCYNNEAAIWKHFREEVDMFSIEPEVIQNYIGESPFCLPISQDAPGNIGSWVGEQIVKAYVEKNPSIGIDELMKMDAKKILEESKYKPK
jgi:hypothetical protein